jgi:aldehyde dehydrogenase (NAD+)
MKSNSAATAGTADLAGIKDSLKLSLTHSAFCTGRQWAKATADGKSIQSYSPVDGQVLGTVTLASVAEHDAVIERAHSAFLEWRKVPAPKRGELVRLMGNAFRDKKEALGALISQETGKSFQEGKGEVQEIIDICDFAVGLSRQLYGLTMHSERPSHRMYEQWHPVGVVGIISAFNFPAAVWAWNSMIAAVCGNVSVWKPSEKAPLTAIACFNLIQEVLETEQVPEGVFNLVIGDASIGERMSADSRIPLLSATGSTRMGRQVAEKVASRMGRTLLELGGNNAIILTPDADLQLAIPSVVFGAVGTAGQRCTTTRRLIVHASIFESVKASLHRAYGSLKIGSPLDEANHVGPLIDRDAVASMQKALETAVSQGAKVVFGGQVLTGPAYTSGCYVMPALVEARNELPIVQEETFAPILYLIPYQGELSEAIRIQNDVKQGLSSAIFTKNLQEAEEFLSAWGSDCGLANVNIGTSGAEIGGAFGGEKETGGGRESGSDSWKAYMRRQTNTINYGKSAPLAQGIRFELG